MIHSNGEIPCIIIKIDQNTQSETLYTFILDTEIFWAFKDDHQWLTKKYIET